MKLELGILDVLHGDCIVINTPAGKTCIVDCHKAATSLPIIEYLKRRSIEEIEFICLTHPHQDHYLGMIELLDYCQSNNIKINRFIDSGLSSKELENMQFTSLENMNYFMRLYSRIGSGCDDNLFDMQEAAAGITLLTEDEFSILVLAPDTSWRRNIQRRLYKYPDKILNAFLNRYSIVLQITYGEETALLLADAEIPDQKMFIEKGRVKGKVNLFKVSHHGSKGCFYKRLYKRYRNPACAIAIISAGCQYGSPSIETIKGLKELKISTYATNTFDYSANSVAADTTIAGVSPLFQQEIGHFLKPLQLPRALMPLHGDISAVFQGGTISISTSTKQPPL